MTTTSGSWWASSWLEAIRALAAERGDRIRRGRSLARQGEVSDLQIDAGGVRGAVGSGPDPFEVHLVVRPFRDDEWDIVFDAMGRTLAHSASLLAGDLDPNVVSEAAASEVYLLPRPRDLSSACTCADDAEPCAHAAAVAHAVADVLRDDPFALLVLRGRVRDEVMGELRRRRGAVPSDIEEQLDTHLPGVDAAEAWTRPRSPLPSVPPIGDQPGRPAAWPTDPPAHAAFGATGLRALVRDAASRAWEVGAGVPEAGLGLDLRSDLARRAARAEPDDLEVMARRGGLAPVELEALAHAWDQAGVDGVRAHDEGRWNPPPLEMAAARDLLAESGLGGRRLHVSGNRVTADGQLQVRRSHDHRWYVFTRSSGRWVLAAPPDRDLAALIDLVFELGLDP